MPAPLYTPETGFNLSAIMHRAWTIRAERMARIAALGPLSAGERREVAREMRSEPLRLAWADAKAERRAAQEAADTAARNAVIPLAERIARADALDRRAFGIECSDRDGSTMHRAYALRHEARQLRAA